MTATRQIRFRKMNGLGNDFVVIDQRRDPVAIDEATARSIADRDNGIGCDQLIMIEPSERADVFMRIRNWDGGEVDACGNATRCIGSLLSQETGKPTALIETNAGILGAAVQPDGQVTIDMGRPRLAWDEIPLAEEFADTRTIELQAGPIDDPIIHSPSAVNMGNPHAIFWVDDLTVIDLGRIGPILENHPIFPERANISLARIDGPDALTLETWERGVGLTRACGTAACASAVAAARKRLTGRTVTVSLPGGPLLIQWREADDHVLMTGPSQLDYEGVFEL